MLKLRPENGFLIEFVCGRGRNVDFDRPLLQLEIREKLVSTIININYQKTYSEDPMLVSECRLLLPSKSEGRKEFGRRITTESRSILRSQDLRP